MHSSPPLGIDPWFPDPPQREDVRDPSDGSLSAAPVHQRGSLAGVLWFLLFASLIALFLGVFAIVPWRMDWSQHGGFDVVFITLGLFGGALATLHGARVCVARVLEFVARVRTVLIGSRLAAAFLRIARFGFGAAAAGLLFLTVPAGLALFDATRRGDVDAESWTFLAIVLGVGWCALSTLMLAVVSLTEFLAAVAVRAAPRLGALRTERLPDGRARIAHLSDLHLTAGEAVPTIEARPGLPVSGNAPFRQVVAEHALRLEGAAAILITGDLTDAGTGAEWRAFFDIYPQRWLPRTVIVPGNHDLNISDPRNLLTAGEGEEQFGRKLRAIRLIAAIDRCQGERTRILDDAGTLVPLRQFLAPLAGELESLIADPPRRTFEESSIGLRETTSGAERLRLELPHLLMRAIFPFVVDVPGTPLRIVVIDSNIEADNVATNAMGMIRADHLQSLRDILRTLDAAQEPCVLAMHHHAALPRRPGQRLLDRAQVAFMACENAAELVAALEGARQRVILHGHRHVKYAGSLGGRLHVLSAPSTTLGNEWGPPPAAGTANAGFALIDLTWGAHGVTVDGLDECRSVFRLGADRAAPQPAPERA